MNKFIEMAKNRDTHSAEALRRNAVDAVHATSATRDCVTRAIAHAADSASNAAYSYAYTKSEYWNGQCELWIKRYEELTNES